LQRGHVAKQQAGIKGMARKVERFAGRAGILNDIVGLGGAEALVCNRSDSCDAIVTARDRPSR